MKSAVPLLETHPDHVRIQKLLYFVYTKLWISDVKAIEGLSITCLLDLLIEEESDSIKRLEIRLLKNAGRLNKADTYVQIAHQIVANLRQSNPSLAQTSVLPYDRFKLRRAIMQVLNPYKAKAVLIALYYAKPPASLDQPIPMESIATVALDELLKKVMHLYPSLKQLDAGLQSFKHFSDDIPSEEIAQLGQTLKEALRPYLLADDPKVLEVEDEIDLDHDSLCTIVMAPTSQKSVSPVMMSAYCPEEV